MFFFSSRRRHTRFKCDWSSDVCSSDLDPAVKDAVVIGLMEGDQGPIVHAVLLMSDPSKAKAVIQQANKQLAPQQHVRSFTIWPEDDFPRTHSLKVKRPEVLNKLQALRSQVKPED